MRLFKRKKEIRRYKPKESGLSKLFWTIFHTIKDNHEISGYIIENASCDQWMNLPSRDLIRRYNINLGYSNAFVWWLLEKYFNGELVEKEKGNESNS